MDKINLQYTTIKSPLPEFIYENLKDYSSGANLYRPQPEELIKKLSGKHKVSQEMIYLTAGIDEAIRLFAHCYGKNTYTFTPTYTVYRRVSNYGGKLNQIYSIEDNEYRIDASKKDDATLIYLANPNNPSGVTLKEKVLDLIKNNPQAMVVIDEAYGEFADLSVISEVKDHKNMAVMRSFSKDYGMAGNRIGYTIAHPNVIKEINDKAQWCNVSYLSVGAALAALDNQEYFKKMREDINKRREEFREFLLDEGFNVLPSGINAVLLKFATEKKGKKFNKYLNDNNFKVSPGNGASNIGLDDSFVRISIGTEDQMNKLQDILDKYKP